MATEVITVVDPDQGTGWDYASLSAWEADFGNTTTGNLVNDDMVATAKCRCTGGTADATAVTIDGFTTDATRYIKIWTDSAESYRHDGKWNAAKYRLALGADYSYVLTNTENYTQVIGIQASNTSGSSGHVLNCSASNCLIEKTIIKGAAASRGLNSSGDNTVRNCIAFDCGDYGILNGEYMSSVIYNCTAIDCGIGFYGAASGSPLFKNCLAHSNTTDFSLASGTCTNCASSDATADDFGGSNNRVNQTFTFVNEAGDDFHLASTDSGAKDFGVDLSASGFSDDIDGDTRSGTWDIGADEYVAAGTTTPPTTLSPTTVAPTTLAPTQPPTTLAPTTISTTPIPTTLAPTTTSPELVVEDVEVNYASTTPPTTIAPTTLSPTTLPPTTVTPPTTSPPTTPVPTTLAPTTVVQPTTAAPTQAPTTEAPTPAPTTLAPTTLAPTPSPTTLAPTTIVPPTTQAPTTSVPTSAPTTLAPTTIIQPTTIAPTPSPTTLAPTTSVPTFPPTTPAPTLAPTTISTTPAPPTIAPTTISSTAVPTTYLTTVVPTTSSPADLCVRSLPSAIIKQLDLQSAIRDLFLYSAITKEIKIGDLCR